MTTEQEKEKYIKESARMLLISINIGLIKLALEDLEKQYGVKTALTLRDIGIIDHYVGFNVCLKPYSVTMLYNISKHLCGITYSVPISGTYVKANTFDKSITGFCVNKCRARSFFKDFLYKDLESNDCALTIRSLFDNLYCAQIQECSDEFFDTINRDLRLVDPQHETVIKRAIK